jgi:beta-galactosidase
MVLRDRNHPSIIVWGIGNEIPEAWTKDGAPIAQKLAARIRSIDSTRPLTEAFPGATYTPATDAVFAQLDIGGYNYNLAQNQAKDHLRVPGRIMMTTESMPAAAFENWQLVKDQPYIVGEFVWTAMDYLGEAGIGGSVVVAAKDAANPLASMSAWPWVNAFCGDIDLIGAQKPPSLARDVVWGLSPLEIAVQRPIPDGKVEALRFWGWSDEQPSWT